MRIIDPSIDEEISFVIINYSERPIVYRPPLDNALAVATYSSRSSRVGLVRTLLTAARSVKIVTGGITRLAAYLSDRINRPRLQLETSSNFDSFKNGGKCYASKDTWRRLSA